MRAALLPLAVLVPLSWVPSAGCSGTPARSAAPIDDGTSYPSDYANWTRLNDAPILLESEASARNVYANAVALSRPAGTGPFPVGSVLVKEERGLRADPQGRLRPGDLFRVSVMFKVGRDDRRGWLFKAFDPESGREFPRDRVDPDGCYFCHADASGGDYVFRRIP